MAPSSRTPEGQPQKCPVCGNPVIVEPSLPPGDAPCPHCGCLLWFPEGAGLGQAYGFLRFNVADASIQTKHQAIAVILDRLVEAGGVAAEHQPGILAAILKREELGSTGVGGGLAVPHATHPGASTAVGAIAHFKSGIEFESLDGEPVNLICLLVSPANRPAEHFQLLEAASQLLRERG